MNLDYSILWFDDDRDFFDSIDLDPIKEEIDSWGFISQIVPVFNAEEFNSHAPFDKYDLIVVDFKLEGMPEGDEFIAKVREHYVYTEIIFYSFNPASDLWKSICERKLEGIFVTNKGGISHKIIRVAKQSIRKVLDLENMRGIVMSEVGDLDALLEEIFVRAMDGISDDKKKDVFARFHKKEDKRIKDFQEALSEFKDSPSIEELLKLCDSNKRWENFNRAKRHHALLKDKSLGDYPVEILMPRNCLAHGIPTREADGSYVFMFHGKEFTFNDDVGKSLRQKIREYKIAFTGITEVLNNK